MKLVLHQLVSQIFVRVSPKLSFLVETSLECWVVELSMESVFFQVQIKPDPWHSEMYFVMARQGSHLQIDSKHFLEIVRVS